MKPFVSTEHIFVFSLLLITPYVFISAVNNSEVDSVISKWEGLEDVYPKHISDYPIRRDFYTKKPVRRGKIELIHGLNKAKDESQKVCLHIVITNATSNNVHLLYRFIYSAYYNRLL